MNIFSTTFSLVKLNGYLAYLVVVTSASVLHSAVVGGSVVGVVGPL